MNLSVQGHNKWWQRFIESHSCWKCAFTAGHSLPCFLFFSLVLLCFQNCWRLCGFRLCSKDSRTTQCISVGKTFSGLPRAPECVFCNICLAYLDLGPICYFIWPRPRLVAGLYLLCLLV